MCELMASMSCAESAAPHPVLGPAAAAVSHGQGKQQAVAGGGQVENPLGDDEAHSEEQVAGWQERDDQQHQAKGQRPGSERKRVPDSPKHILLCSYSALPAQPSRPPTDSSSHLLSFQG